MIRILHIVGRMNRAGAETMLMNLYRKLDTTKFQFDFVYFTDEICDYDDEIEALGGRIYKIHGNPKTPIHRALALYKLIKKEKSFAVIHCHQMFSNALHLVAAYFSGVPMRIAHSHNTSDINSKTFTGKIYHYISRNIISKFATHFIACGENAGKFLFPNNKHVIFLPNAIDLKTFIEASDKTIPEVFNDENIKPHSIIISQIGRLSTVKNHIFTLNLAYYLKNKQLDFHIVIVGAGELEGELKGLSRKLDLENQITFCGTRSDISTILKKSTLMIMPSLFEGFPVVLVESQASGTPALISSEISKEVDMELGLVHFCDLNSGFDVWHDAIVKIVNSEKINPTAREKKLSEKGYNINLSVKKLEAFYEQAK